MATVRTSDFESTIGGWYKNVPHLPKNAQQWLADNIWWLALIGAILSALGLFVIIPLLFTLLTLGTMIDGMSLYAHVGIGGVALQWLNLMITVISYIGTTIILALAVGPLKAKVRTGWELLFWAYLIEAVLGIVIAVISFSFFSLGSNILSALIGGYFLFEIRSYFVIKHAAVKKAKVVKAKTK